VADAVERLARIAGMLGSAHEGERAAAAKMASTMLKALGLTWSEIIYRGLGAPNSRRAHQSTTNEAQSPSSDQGSSQSWRHQARHDDWGTRKRRVREHKGVPAWKWVDELLKHEGRLGSWDRQFLKCLRDLGKTARKDLALTAAQWSYVESIAKRLGWRPKG
jgi:hypothetical protein